MEHIVHDELGHSTRFCYTFLNFSQRIWNLILTDLSLRHLLYKRHFWLILFPIYFIEIVSRNHWPRLISWYFLDLFFLTYFFLIGHNVSKQQTEKAVAIISVYYAFASVRCLREANRPRYNFYSNSIPFCVFSFCFHFSIRLPSCWDSNDTHDSKQRLHENLIELNGCYDGYNSNTFSSFIRWFSTMPFHIFSVLSFNASIQIETIGQWNKIWRKVFVEKIFLFVLAQNVDPIQMWRRNRNVLSQMLAALKRFHNSLKSGHIKCSGAFSG